MSPTLVRRYPVLVGAAHPEPGFDVLAVDRELRTVYGVVKGLDDSSPDAVEDSAHGFMRAAIHDPGERAGFTKAAVWPVESAIAPCDFRLGDGVVKQGEWFVGLHVDDPSTWSQVEQELGVR